MSAAHHAGVQEVIDRAYEVNAQMCALPEEVKKATADEEGQMTQFPWMSKVRARMDALQQLASFSAFCAD